MGISSSRLCHIFKDFMGISLWNYVINRRIRKARQLLQQGLSITDACFECGFQDYSHFIKSFHKIVGVPPRKYIQGILPPPPLIFIRNFTGFSSIFLTDAIREYAILTNHIFPYFFFLVFC